MPAFFSNWLKNLLKTNESTGQYGTARTPRAPQRNGERLDRIAANDKKHRNRRLDPYDVTDAETWDEITDADIIEDEPLDISSPENAFLAGEVLYTPQSSNVHAIQYMNSESILIIGYGGKPKQPGVTWYGYNPIQPEHALEFFRVSSKGGKVWDDLRIRGTVFGYKVDYWIMDGPSTHVPLWHRAGDESISRHGAIPKSGEPFEGYHPATNYAGAKGGMGKKRGNSKPWNKGKK